MPEHQKVRSVRRRKRRFTGNRFTKKQGSGAEQPPGMSFDEECPNEDLGPSSNDETQQHPESVPASSGIADEEDNDTSESDGEIEPTTTGYRPMDLSALASVFSLLICPDCKEPGLRMQELQSSKMGFASTMKLFCQHCEFVTTFYTSKRTGQFF